MSRYRIFILYICVLVTVFYYVQRRNSFFLINQFSVLNQIPINQTVLGTRTKTTGCKINGALPDPDCSPGAIFPNATVFQICQSGYSKSVRNVSVATKNQVYHEYGIYSHKPYEYEVDHIVSLELGGSNDISNLFPEVAVPAPGYHEKDMVENYLHDQVCSHKVSLAKAQELIAKNWLQVYQIMPK